jgi:hypothetical protein
MKYGIICYFRYANDILIKYSLKMQDMLNEFNNYKQTIKFTIKEPNNTVSFLDITNSITACRWKYIEILQPRTALSHMIHVSILNNQFHTKVLDHELAKTIKTQPRTK